MEDRNGIKVEVGDVVELWKDHVGSVVCALDDRQFTDAFPQSEWGYLAKGAIIKSDDGNIFHYEVADEDFSVVRKHAMKTAS